MLGRFGWFIVRRRRWVLAITALATAVMVPLFASIDDRLSFEAFSNPGSESADGHQLLVDEFDYGAPNLVLVVTAREGDVDSTPVVVAAGQLADEMDRDGQVTDVASYWSTGVDQFRSTDGRRALMVARITGSDDEIDQWYADNKSTITGERGPVDVRSHGQAAFFHELTEASIEDFERAEYITIPVILVALLVVFGSVVAGLLPLVVAVLAVLGTGTFLIGMTLFTDVSLFALTLVATLGLGLSVDYSLFVLNRFREELQTGASVEQAVVTSVTTAGRTVLFSALAVMISLLSLLFIPIGFLRAMGIAAMSTALFAMIASIVVLPAMLATVGRGVDRGAVRRRAIDDDRRGFWYRSALAVMRHPVAVAGTLILALVVVALPAFHLELGLPDDRTFSEGAEFRETGDILRGEFPTLAGSPLLVVLRGDDVGPGSESAQAFAAQIAAQDMVDTVTGPIGGDTVSYVSVTASVDPISNDGERLVGDLRALDHPFDEVLVTGDGPMALDLKDAILGAIPGAIAFIALATFVILFLQFGSILVPLKAILLNTLSIGAMLGALAWVFQDGHLSGLLGFTATDSLYIVMPIIIFALAFGLSMDYEVFLLSRIKEEYDRSGDNDSAVAIGLDKCGRIVSAAAVLISLVFLTAGLTSSLRLVKVFGLGLASVVLLDAFIIRGTLVPALMKLAGAANWWAPAPLKRMQQRIGLTEVEAEPVPSQDERTAVTVET